MGSQTLILSYLEESCETTSPRFRVTGKVIPTVHTPLPVPTPIMNRLTVELHQKLASVGSAGVLTLGPVSGSCSMLIMALLMTIFAPFFSHPVVKGSQEGCTVPNTT